MATDRHNVPGKYYRRRSRPVSLRAWIPSAVIYGNLAASLASAVWKGDEFPLLNIWLIASTVLCVGINAFVMIRVGDWRGNRHQRWPPSTQKTVENQTDRPPN